MKVIIQNRIFDSYNEPIVIVWDDDEQRKASISHISGMQDKEGPRIYLQYPNGTKNPMDEILKMLNLPPQDATGNE